ncbi:MAG: fasciclin domain-containing protein [Mucilaginibacter sp.]
MKKLILILLILLHGPFAFSQKSDTAKLGKIINVNGTMMNSSSTVFANLSASPGFSNLINVIQTADLASTFSGSNPVTVFAPTNDAFKKMVAGQLDTLLLLAHKIELAKLVMYHVIAGKITSKDLQRQIKVGNGQAILTTLSGNILTAKINENRNIVLTDEAGGQSIISRFDIPQSNGILHIVTSVLVLKTK